MDTRLLEACMSGDEQALQELIRHDPLILDRAVTCCEETPLHVAVLRRHPSFVRALLGHEPELVSERDASGCVPLHLASAKGSADIVRELLSVDAELCSARDHCGRTPLHLAVMKGRLDVVRELIRVCPESASERLDRGETVFHLSIRYCRLEALKLLVELLKDDPRQLLVATDDEGNTVLHFAVFFKQIQTVRYLVSLEEVKAIASDTNRNGHTALDDVMEKSPRDLNNFEIVETLTQVGVGRGRDGPSNPTSVLHSPPPLTTTNSAHTDTSIWYSAHTDSSMWYSTQKDTKSLIEKSFDHLSDFLIMIHRMDWISESRGNLMVVATVIASMSFQAGINPPGGVWQADTMDKHNCTKPDMCRAGTAVFKDAKGFNSFYTSNTLALVSAISVILLHFAGFPLKNKIGTWVMTFITCLMLHNILWAYMFSMDIVVKPFGENKALIYICYAWMVMLVLVMIVHTSSISYWDMFASLSAESRLRSRKWIIPVAFVFGTLVTFYVLKLLGDLYGCTTFSASSFCLVGFR